MRMGVTAASLLPSGFHSIGSAPRQVDQSEEFLPNMIFFQHYLRTLPLRSRIPEKQTPQQARPA
jgi:hypothetical protein